MPNESQARLFGRIRDLRDIFAIFGNVDFTKIQEIVDLGREWLAIGGELTNPTNFPRRAEILAKLGDLVTDLVPGDKDDEIAELLSKLVTNASFQETVRKLLEMAFTTPITASSYTDASALAGISSAMKLIPILIQLIEVLKSLAIDS